MQKVIKQKKGYYKEQFPNIVRKFTLTLHSALLTLNSICPLHSFCPHILPSS